MPGSVKRVDMSKVTDRKFNPKHLPAGEYKAQVVKCDDHKTDEGKDNWLYTIKLVDKRGIGATYPHYCGQTTKQLWKVRNLLQAAGVNVAKKVINLDPNKAVGKYIGVTLEDDEYDGKMKSVVADVMPLSDLGADEDADEDDEEVEEEEESEDEDDESEDEDEDEDDEDDEEEPPPPPKKKKSAKAERAAKRKAAAKKKSTDEVDDDELEELEIEDL